MEYNKAAEAEKEDGTHYIGRKLVSLLLLLLVATEYSADGNIDSLMRFDGGLRIFFFFYCLTSSSPAFVIHYSVATQVPFFLPFSRRSQRTSQPACPSRQLGAFLLSISYTAYSVLDMCSRLECLLRAAHRQRRL
jgi:hypothetical protein